MTSRIAPNTAILHAKPTTVPAVRSYTYLGCSTEATNVNRAAMTVENCMAFCQATGLEWS